jgi:hypothetical protein
MIILNETSSISESEQTAVDKNIESGITKITVEIAKPGNKVWSWIYQGIPYQTISTITGILFAIKRCIGFTIRGIENQNNKHYDIIREYHPDTAIFHRELLKLLDKQITELKSFLKANAK